jgi:hypothetical protein
MYIYIYIYIYVYIYVCIGTGIGYSVLDMVNAMKTASGRPLPYEFGPRREVCLYMSIYVYLHIFVYTYLCIFIQVFYERICTYTYVYIYVYVYMHMYACICIYSGRPLPYEFGPRREVCIYLCLYVCHK